MPETRITVRLSSRDAETLAAVRGRTGWSTTEVLRRALRAFAEAGDTATVEGEPDADEVLRLLGEKARDGHVGAMTAILRHREREAREGSGGSTPENQFAGTVGSGVVDLAERRARR